MIGDSITHGWEDSGREVWAEFYAARNALNLGFSGDRTEHVIWRLQNGAIDDIAPKLAVLMIGSNNTGHRSDAAEHTAAGIQRVISELRLRLPETKILLLGIFPRGEQPDHPLRQWNNAINALISGFAEDPWVTYLDVAGAFLEADGTLSSEIMPDFLHPGREGYRRWAAAMEATLQALL
ncbi:MAG: GDSL-type esterase/lipase family protein [Planctomycetota bacterium]